jgi:hypothetical protein
MVGAATSNNRNGPDPGPMESRLEEAREVIELSKPEWPKSAGSR